MGETNPSEAADEQTPLAMAIQVFSWPSKT